MELPPLDHKTIRRLHQAIERDSKTSNEEEYQAALLSAKGQVRSFNDDLSQSFPPEEELEEFLWSNGDSIEGLRGRRLCVSFHPNHVLAVPGAYYVRFDRYDIFNRDKGMPVAKATDVIDSVLLNYPQD